MSRKFQEKNKDLVNLVAVTSDMVWTVKNGKARLRRDVDIYGRVDKGTSSFITSTNLKGEHHKFVEDTISLSNKTKNRVIDLLKNNNRNVVYLVKPHNGSIYSTTDKEKK